MLRIQNYVQIPRHGATFDEFAWTWLGINLIQKKQPISWSPHPQYKNRYHLVYQGAAFLIVQPYLEHPPLFGLVAGGFALINHVRSMNDVTLSKIRPLAIILGIFSVIMVFVFTNEIYGNKIALISSLLYSTVPTIVIGSRIVQNENFLVPFWLLSMYLLMKYLKQGKKRFRNIAAIIAGLLSLAKVPWLVAGISLSMLLSYKGKWKDALIIGFIVAFIFSFYIIYGLYYDKELFINLLRLQTSRYDISFAGFFSIFTKPLLVDRYYLDGWIFFGWFSIFYVSKDFKKNFFVLIPFLAYFVLYLFGIPDEPSHGWYRYPFYPFLLISAAIILKEEISKISLKSLFFILIVGLSLLYNTWLPNFGFSYFLYRLFIISAILSVLPFLWFKKISNRLNTIMIIFWLVVFIFLNIFSVTSFIE